MEQKIVLPDAAATEKLATEWAGTIDKGSIILLYGDLGAGKTCFARAFIRARMGDIDLVVPSPTFTLVQEYEREGETLLHLDLYRMEDEEELHAIGWQRVGASGVTTLIEWPERLSTLPDDAITIHLDTHDAGRIATITKGAV